MRKANKKGETIKYFVVFGEGRHSADRKYSSSEKFEYLKDARTYASNFTNAYIFKGIEGDMGLLSYSEVK